jgi:hypothetical protein
MLACSRSGSPPRWRTSRSITLRGKEAGDWRLETEYDTVDGGPANGDWGPEAGGREPMGGPAHAKALRRDKRWIRQPARDGRWP